jgi:PAS domain S-box-containing protein
MTSDAIYSFRATPDGEFALEWANDRLARLTGYTPEDLRVPGAWRAMLEGFPEVLEELISRLDASGTGVVEVPFSTKSGEIRWVRNYFRVERDADDGRIVRILEAAQDITERRQAEAERRALQSRLQEAQKLESLAVLAGGIAHDFNNLLAIILGSVDLARMELPPDSPAQELLAPIGVAVTRASALTQQMLAYSGMGHFLIDQIDVNALLRQLHEPIRVAIGDRVTATYQLAPQLPPIEADSSQIRQLVLNLAINAAEAIGQASGVITISTSVRRVDRAFLAETYLAPELPEGRYVALEVADTGSGMDQATLARIFEPFFTTRFTGRGLGLAAVLGIVRGHHGAVHVWSAPGQGTRFTVLFPAADGETMDEPAGQLAP